MSWEFGDAADEQYQALLTSATLVDVHSLHVIQIKGPDALGLADRLVTRNVAKMPMGRSSYVFVCDEEGLILADPVMLLLDEQTVWLTVGTVDLLLWVRGIAVASAANVLTSVQVSGPKAKKILQSVTEAALDGLRPYHCLRTKVAGLDVVISTTGYSGEVSFEVYLIGAEPYPKGSALGNKLWRAIRDVGAPLGLKESPVQYDRSVEAGFVTIGHTDGDRINALEHWRQRVVDFSAGDFIGKRALQALQAAGGPPRRMVGLVATDPAACFALGQWDMDIYHNDAIVGTTRRIAFSRHLGRAIAIGLVNRNVAAPGARLMLPHAGGVDEVEVTDLPFMPSKTG
jgi:aminomethyltransferase